MYQVLRQELLPEFLLDALFYCVFSVWVLRYFLTQRFLIRWSSGCLMFFSEYNDFMLQLVASPL